MSGSSWSLSLDVVQMNTDPLSLGHVSLKTAGFNHKDLRIGEIVAF